ncbi:uncharacterized protein J4E78_004067 [Alternaria triticimaculans]|uniref:uncharacterized protein n=1 Tax=Alternaria triticimaculans TaxID=297637 RepID=UPI0020C428D0|nr:uncharacterized protein J4E78_004067 [Alternaria triticimaculans]KAI4663651.1 hypothetical protein J4E78_004067 [Alternaria triticimaculans]
MITGKTPKTPDADEDLGTMGARVSAPYHPTLPTTANSTATPSATHQFRAKTTATMFSSTFRAAARAPTSTFARSFSSTRPSQVARMTVIGRLGVAPEEVTVSGDRTLVRYVVGTSYGKGEDKKTSWFRIASFVQGAQKDFLMNVPKGSMLYVDADARMETYLDSEGNKKSNLSLVARNFDVLSRARTEDTENNDEGLVQEASG